VLPPERLDNPMWGTKMAGIAVCRFDELADGAIRRFMVDDDFPIAIIRCGDGVHALLDSCPHRGAPLSKGTVDVELREVICPWHFFRFKLPYGESASGSDLKVPAYEVTIEDGVVTLTQA
jgi:nitrite reductase/ring-hydroxylating ferredoxin subunit